MKEKVISIPTWEISGIVQEKLFELGYKWRNDRKTFFDIPVEIYGKKTYLSLNEDKTIRYCYRDLCLKECPERYEEITMYDLYQMKSDTIELTTKDGEVIEFSRKSLEGLKKL